MCKLKWSFLQGGLIVFVLLLSTAMAGAFTANVKPMADDGVLRVLYYGGIKGNIAPCG